MNFRERVLILFLLQANQILSLIGFMEKIVQNIATFQTKTTLLIIHSPNQSHIR